MDITVQYTLTESDLGMAITRNLRRGRPRGLVSAALWLAPGAIFVTLGDRCWGVGMVMIGVLMLLLMLQPSSLIARRWAKRMAGNVRLDLYDDWFSYAVNDEGASGKPWDKTRVVVGPDYMTFVVERKPVLVMPKRALTPEQQAELTEFLEGRPKRQLLHV